ncbi:MAG TPA: Tm-1-like ATP-binding domain-containing protein [Thermoleophilia bacterium]|nr:Tm-1-like ATP-binding domain-containing protein [Thermoleophilia bacterium]
MAEKTVLLVTNLDTRGAEFAQVRDLVLAQGLDALIMDVSMETAPPFPGDITCEHVAEAGGLTIEAVREAYHAERKVSTDCMIRGGGELARCLYDEGRIHGVLGAGGATATLIATSIMKRLPFGLPKVMASSVGSHPGYVGRYVGTKDIMMLNTVVDVMGTNHLLWQQLRNAAGAVCGAVKVYERPPGEGAAAPRAGATEPAVAGPAVVDPTAAVVTTTLAAGSAARPIVGITSFGFAERCVERLIEVLRAAGFEPVPFHAQGQGDRAMDELIRDGMLAGVIDVVTRGVVEELLGGNCAAGLDRVLAAAEMGVPQVIAPSGLDMLSVGGQADWRTRFSGRPYAVIDELRVEVRTSAEECRAAARIVAERLNRATAPFRFLVPTLGWSSLDREGAPLWDPAADAAFVAELRSCLDDPTLVVEVAANLYSTTFADACAEAFLEVWGGAGATENTGSRRRCAIGRRAGPRRAPNRA